MLTTIWMWIHEWSDIRRRLAFACATCHHAFSCSSAFAASISASSGRLPRVGALIRTGASASRRLGAGFPAGGWATALHVSRAVGGFKVVMARNRLLHWSGDEGQGPTAPGSAASFAVAGLGRAERRDAPWCSPAPRWRLRRAHPRSSSRPPTARSSTHPTCTWRWMGTPTRTVTPTSARTGRSRLVLGEVVWDASLRSRARGGPRAPRGRDVRQLSRRGDTARLRDRLQGPSPLSRQRGRDRSVARAPVRDQPGGAARRAGRNPVDRASARLRGRDRGGRVPASGEHRIRAEPR